MHTGKISDARGMGEGRRPKDISNMLRSQLTAILDDNLCLGLATFRAIAFNSLHHVHAWATNAKGKEGNRFLVNEL